MAKLDAFCTDQSTLNEQQYAKGLETGRNATEIHIGYFGSWSARMKDGGSLTAYERIGYHAGTDALMQGFRDSGTPIFDHRKEA